MSANTAEIGLVQAEDSQACGKKSTVPIDALRGGYSPRFSGEDEQHVRLLAESGAHLPPIVLRAGTTQVIDGMHRLEAARLRGDRFVDVVFFEGTDDEAFVESVKANVTHGLPLSRAEREAAVARILSAEEARSDRWVASVVGLSAGTVAAIRRRLHHDGGQTVRIGRDGKARPLDSTARRSVAREAMIEHPEASLREIARIAGLSPTTVRDVRDKLDRDTEPARQARPPQPAADVQPAPPLRPVAAGKSRDVLFRQLQRDPSIRFGEAGRTLLRWLSGRAAGPGNWKEILDAAPPHSIYLVAEMASRCAQEWDEVADYLESRVNEAEPAACGRQAGRRRRTASAGPRAETSVSAITSTSDWRSRVPGGRP